MIDANRLSHTLATALKDRPHGIPVQPNRSLPLRPPPPLPVRIPIPKSQKNTPITRGNATSEATQKSGNSDKRSSLHREDDTNDALSGLECVGMNFYDSKDKVEHSNNNCVGNVARRKPKELAKPRLTKSLDDEETDESSHNAKRRKSFGYETIRRDVDSKQKNTSNFDWAQSRTKVTGDKKGPGSGAKKRKSSSAEENLDVSRKTKSPKLRNFDGGISSANFTASSNVETTEPSTRSMNLNAAESSGRGLPTIFKYRNSPSTSPQLADRNLNFKASDVGDKSNWKQTSSNTYKHILPKPQSIPKCPVAIPIAHALNQGESRNFKINPEANNAGIAKSHTSNLGPVINEFDLMKPNINVGAGKTHIPETVEEIENTLPSMPSLEDMLLTESLQDKTKLLKNQANIEDVELHADEVSMPIVQAKVLQIAGDLESKTSDLFDNEPIQGNMNAMNDHKLNQPHTNESIVNLTTVLEIQIPGRSPEVIILTAPQIMAGGKVDSVANNSPIQTKTPVALSSSIQQALDEPKKIEEITNIETVSGLTELGEERHQESPGLRKSCTNLAEKASEGKNPAEISSADVFLLPNDNQQQCQDLSGKGQPQYILKHKSPVEFEVRIRDTCSEPQTEEPVQKCREDEPVGEKAQEIAKDSQARSKVDESIVKCRINRLTVKLKKLYEEESHLKFKMSQTSDASRLTRLQQRINCAEKKIENTQKYLNKLISIENPSLYANPAPLRIQVRRDLVQPIPSPKSVEPAPQSPLRPTDKSDMNLTGRSPPVSPPVIITLSETDSASSGDETDVNDGKSPDNIKPYLQSGVETKFPVQNVAENDSRIACTAVNPLPKVDTDADDLKKLNIQDASVQSTPLNVNSKMTNINMEYVSNNLPPVCTGVPVSVINAPTIIPPVVQNPGNFSASNADGYARQKSPSVQYAPLNLTSTPDRVERQVGKRNFDCLPCTQNNTVVPANSRAEFDVNNFVPSTVNDLRIPKMVSQTTAPENTNAHPVPNYPVHRNDYRASGNVPSMFSRDNGGANINLSSPLQGHSALPLPPPYYRNLTAQGYSMPGEPSPNQTIRWHNQYPSTKSSTQFTPDQDVPSHSSILAAHLLKSQAQEPAYFNNSMKLSSHVLRTDTTQTNPAKHVSNRIITEQFPTLGNWAAQMTRESTTRQTGNHATAPSSNTHPQVDLGYKTTGSDMYKMAATAIDARRPISPANLIHWPPGKPWPDQPRPTQGLPGQRSNPHLHRTDYPPNPRNPQNSHKPLPPYPGSEIFMPRPIPPYHQVPSGHQTTRNTEQSNNHSSHSQQNARQYQPQTSLNRPLVPGAYQYQGSSGQFANSTPLLSQQYLPQGSPYVPPMIPQWHAGSDYHKNYINPQFNGYNVQTKPVDPMGYRPANKNHAPLQPNHPTMSRQLMQNISKIRLPSPMYNMSAAFNSIVQDGRNAEPLDLGRSFAAPHLGKVHKSLDRSNALRCSLCGMTGPRFNCNGCETAFYCNEHCQAQHWSTHYLECPKKMPKLKKVS